LLQQILSHQEHQTNNPSTITIQKYKNQAV